MGGKLYLAANQIPTWGLNHFGHLQIVTTNETGVLVETEVQAPTIQYNFDDGTHLRIPYLLGDWVVFNNGERNHSDYTEGFEETGKYERVEIDLAPAELPEELHRDAENVWEIILQASAGIREAYLPYWANINSNSYVNTLLASVSIDLEGYIQHVTPSGVTWGFPGYDTDVRHMSVLVGAFPAGVPVAPVSFTITGTDGVDFFNGGDGDDYIAGGNGNDILSDGAGLDIISGGGGDDSILLVDDDEYDVVVLGDGKNYISGHGSDADRIVLRLSDFAPHLLEQYPSIETAAVPLLGGFGGEYPDIYESATALLEVVTVSEPGHEMEWWHEIKEKEAWPYQGMYGPLTIEVTYTAGIDGSLEIVYDVYEAILKEYNGFEYWWDEWLGGGTVVIEYFALGDFGIQFYDYTLHEDLQWDDGTIYDEYLPDNKVAFDAIWNDGTPIMLGTKPPEWSSNPDTVYPIHLNEIEGTEEDDEIEGTEKADLIYSRDGDDTVTAAGGDDLIIGGNGHGLDSYDGGDGSDTVVYTSAIAPVSVDLQSGYAYGSDIDTDTLENIENVYGGAGDDDLSGDAENNLFLGGDGGDVIDGRDGSDTAAYEEHASAYQVRRLANGRIQVEKDGVIDQLHSVEFLMFSDKLIDVSTLEVEDPATEINGTNGDDSLFGTGNDDIIRGGDGNDVLYGGTGDDILDGESGSYNQADYDGYAVDYALTQNPDGSITVVNPTYGADTLTNIHGVWFLAESAWYDPQTLLTNRGTNAIIGTSGDDFLEGTQAGDVISGGDGNDTLYGGRGDDTLNGEGGSYNQADYDGSASDYIYVWNGDGTVTVSHAIYGEDILSDIDAIWFRGEEALYDLSDLISTGWAGTPDTVQTEAGTPVALNLLANDTIPADANYAHYIWTQPENGTVYWSATQNSFIYEPNAGFTGTDILTYGIHDQDNGGVAMTPEGVEVTIEVTVGTGGSPGQTVYVGSGYSNYFGGSTGDDTINFTGGTGNYVDAGDGDDIIVFSGNASQYEIVGQGEHFTITDSTTGEGIQFKNSEYVRFGDTDDVSLDDIIANSGYAPGETWFEPEPIGGLI